ncbi:MAG TPA: heavy metal translocating P-type ATPase, partial [Bacillota bacterium]|nr:heavy metal translocating P-type ATPase [Bacillota bacterium]
MAGENHSCHCSDDNVHGHDCHGHGKGNETARVYETVLALALFAVGMLVKAWSSSEAAVLVSDSILLASYIAAGWRVLWGAARNILRGQVFDEFFLMSIASLGAIAIGELPEAVGVMAFFAVGELLQDRAVERSRTSIRALMDVRPDYA